VVWVWGPLSMHVRGRSMWAPCSRMQARASWFVEWACVWDLFCYGNASALGTVLPAEDHMLKQHVGPLGHAFCMGMIGYLAEHAQALGSARLGCLLAVLASQPTNRRTPDRQPPKITIQALPHLGRLEREWALPSAAWAIKQQAARPGHLTALVLRRQLLGCPAPGAHSRVATVLHTLWWTRPTPAPNERAPIPLGGVGEHCNSFMAHLLWWTGPRI